MTTRSKRYMQRALHQKVDDTEYFSSRTVSILKLKPVNSYHGKGFRLILYLKVIRTASGAGPLSNVIKRAREHVASQQLLLA
jgi:hypothetical protein